MEYPFKTVSRDSKKAKAGLCVRVGCKKHQRRKGVCSSDYRLYRQFKNPLFIIWEDFVSNGSKRGKKKGFAPRDYIKINFQQFREIWEREPRKLKEKLEGIGNWQLDRITGKQESGEEGVYEPGNIQLLSLTDNVKKSWDLERGRGWKDERDFAIARKRWGLEF